ncbi:MAG: DUF4097 family beta strand repeat protein [Clostridia bacterium]|nr:DUF4097 family beta strand repeat protein [Clostridia bacterium]
MKKVIGILLVIVIVVGFVIFLLAFASAGFSFTNMVNGNAETNTYAVSAEFDKIDISTSETDVTFMLADAEGIRVVCTERSKMKHTVTVEDGTLKVIAVDERKWYERISFFSGALRMTVYLPSKVFASLKIEDSTGDVSIPKDFLFGNIDVTASTGDVDCRASVTELLKISISTGSIYIKELTAEKMALSVSTGKVTAESVTCNSEISIDVSTGKTTLTDLTCQTFVTSGSTGQLVMKDVVATDNFTIERSTGNIRFDHCDAGDISIKTSTGDVSGTLRSGKIFVTRTSTGIIRVPDSITGGRCEISTSTGDIEIGISE